uniref:tRNA-specific adenosine deaminase subunit tad2-like n=1 Tax=Saccoglossus kowalevskii TaxID=10224 RepID=A0ABM0M1B7_SACKO|nr:PREDICTED: tRNA-specific adenosine deaminase subunit tad2-like [Saccoglossus kowalevskii]
MTTARQLPTDDEKRRFMRRAVDLSYIGAFEEKPGTTWPFAAIIVKAGKIIEHVRDTTKYIVTVDPTAHAEVVAIRNTCDSLKTSILSGCDIYTSCEPCNMCTAAILLAGIERVYYGATVEKLVEKQYISISSDLKFEVLVHPRPAEYYNIREHVDDSKIYEIWQKWSFKQTIN